VVGHRGTIADGVRMLELFDAVMAGVVTAWDDAEGLVIVTSDHGNMEDLSHTKHTENDVPTLIIGREHAHFAEGLHTLADLVPQMAQYLFAA
jgi:bisphosphoglycerate-independent phosphoglycerate mutase (AlkP superfamily)